MRNKTSNPPGLLYQGGERMNNFPFLSYDKNLVLKARELRKNPTNAEKLFWQKILKSKDLKIFTFLRQKPLGHFIVDFYCSKLRVAIEIDGGLHDFQKSRDRERDNILKQNFGIKIVRYKNEDILRNPEKILEDLLNQINPLPT